MSIKYWLLAALALTLAACGSSGGDEPGDPAGPTTTTQPEQADTSPDTNEGDATAEVPSHLQPMAERWGTDFSNSVVDLNELLVGIPVSDPRDRIPPIDEPNFDSVENTDWIEDREPGVLMDINDDARFYPLSIMTRHEVVNDEIGGEPVAVTYCPLCNTAVAFERTFEGDVLRMGVSGLLRNSDLVMWDLQSESLWQQVTGEAIVGEHAGKSLTPIASAIVRWADFKTNHPDGLAMTQDQGFGTNYGRNPYEGYSSSTRPFLFRGEVDDRFPALSRVVGVTLPDAEKAYPFSLLVDERVVNDDLGGQPVVIFWGSSDTADALGSGVIAEAESIGTGIAYDPVVNGQQLTFEAAGDAEFVDNETGTTWTILGKAIDGELEGEELELVSHKNEFWFAWQAFFPDAEVWTG